MSMLTPLGTGGRSRRTRRWPKVLLVIVVLAAVGAGAYGAWRWLSERDDGTGSAAPTPSKICRTPTAALPDDLPRPNQIRVDVANGTDRPGLALDTADVLAERGFTVEDIGNADKPVKTGVAEVRYTAGELDAAITIASYVPDSQLLEVSKKQAARPALWLGSNFPGVEQGIARQNEADPSTVELPTKEPVCRKPE